jgi:flavin-dependent dehydrogenase
VSDLVDLAIIGAGPAGCALALHIARSGFEVVLCEQHRIPRDKLCGEFLSPDALAQLRVLGLDRDLAPDLGFPPAIDRVRVTVAGQKDLVHPLAPPALGISRFRLDAALAAACSAAGVRVVDRWRATRVHDDSGAFIVDGVNGDGGRQQLRARVVAAAFGREERLGETPRSVREGSCQYIAWKGHRQGEGPGTAVELHVFPGGYCGVAAVEGDRTNVCGLATRETFRKAGSSIEALVREASRQNPALARRLGRLEPVCPTPLTAASMSFRRRQPIAGQLLCLGDAAALIAPLCGDGIGMALASAALAHGWVRRFLEGEEVREAMLSGYAHDWRQAFLPQLELGGMLQRLLLEPRTAAWTVGICRTLPALTGWLVRHTRDAALVR